MYFFYQLSSLSSKQLRSVGGAYTSKLYKYHNIYKWLIMLI